MQKSKPLPSASKTQGKSTKQLLPEWKERISPEQLQQLRDIFLLFDQDGSGTIDPQQIVKVLQELGIDKRNPYVINVVWALREKNKILNFDQFVEVVCQKTGENKTRDGIKRVFDLYDKQQKGEIRFEQLKEITKFIGESLTDEDILQMMHSVFINNKTQSNETFTFDEFYEVISQFQPKHH